MNKFINPDNDIFRKKWKIIKDLDSLIVKAKEKENKLLELEEYGIFKNDKMINKYDTSRYRGLENELTNIMNRKNNPFNISNEMINKRDKINKLNESNELINEIKDNINNNKNSNIDRINKNNKILYDPFNEVINNDEIIDKLDFKLNENELTNDQLTNDKLFNDQLIKDKMITNIDLNPFDMDIIKENK